MQETKTTGTGVPETLDNSAKSEIEAEIMKTENIEKLLMTVSDQILANLQAACEDGKMMYMKPCRCLLGFCGGNVVWGYSALKFRKGALGDLARSAEFEFRDLGSEHQIKASTITEDMKHNDPIRMQYLLPLIHAEWSRRESLRAQIPPTDIPTALVLS